MEDEKLEDDIVEKKEDEGAALSGVSPLSS